LANKAKGKYPQAYDSIANDHGEGSPSVIALPIRRQRMSASHNLFDQKTENDSEVIAATHGLEVIAATR